MQIIALLIATLIPIIILYIIRALDLYQMGAFRTVLSCFIWGGAAFGAAYYLNWIPYNRDMVSYQDTLRFVAPIFEELLKVVILIYLVRQPRFTYFVDGAIYGFAAGIGFAVVENYQYLLGASSPGLGDAIGRVLSANLMHASASALVGVALGQAKFKQGWGRVITTVIGLLAAMALHIANNNVASRVSGIAMLGIAAALGLVGVAIIAVIIFRGIAEQKKWIEEKLGMADRVTTQEARLVHRLDDLQEILEPLAATFGAEKADQIEKFLIAQAQLGIKRKTLDKLPDERMRRAVEEQMDALRAEMNEARKAVGSYIMLYVRNIFPEDASPLWGLLGNRIQERIEARARDGEVKSNLFANLGQRIGKPAVEENNLQDQE